MSSLTPYKGRTASDGQRVKAYYNLHRGGYSVVAADGPDKGLVIAHAEELLLGDVTFAVSEAGRQRVIREKRKNVHAYAIGNLVTSSELMRRAWDIPGVAATTSYVDGAIVETQINDWIDLHYNPYMMGKFYYIADDGFLCHVCGAGMVYLTTLNCPPGCYGRDLVRIYDWDAFAEEVAYRERMGE